MSKKPTSIQAIDPTALQAFGNAAAGHEGVLSDESGSVVIKPCVPVEVAFYEAVNASHPDLAQYLPTFMGTLSLGKPDAGTPSYDTQWEGPPESLEPIAPPVEREGVIQTANGPERLHGRKLDTDLSVVLENAAYGFKKPNILDLKLGAQLWDEGAKPEKRARLDKIAAETTSSSLGFRIAGARTWHGVDAQDPVATNQANKGYVDLEKDNGYWVYNKMYGRKFSAENVLEGFRDFFLPSGTNSKQEVGRAIEALEYFKGEVAAVQKIFESKESRMYSASLLLVYEGDLAAYKDAKKRLTTLPSKPIGADEEDEDDDTPPPKLATLKVIDFAHATFTPGQGPDENALKGIRSTVSLLSDLIKEVEKDTI